MIYSPSTFMNINCWHLSRLFSIISRQYIPTLTSLLLKKLDKPLTPIIFNNIFCWTKGISSSYSFHFILFIILVPGLPAGIVCVFPPSLGTSLKFLSSLCFYSAKWLISLFWRINSFQVRFKIQPQDYVPISPQML